MALLKLLSPCRTTLLLVATLSAARLSVAAPTADIVTAVSSAPNPAPNLTPGDEQPIHKKEEIFFNAPNSEDEITKRSINIVPTGTTSPEAGVQQESGVDDGATSPDPSPKHLGKRQTSTRQRSWSAPAILSTPPDTPNTNAEEDAIGAAAEKIKQAADEAVNHMESVANAAVRNAAEEQKDGVDNPNFHGSQDDNSYVWPSASPVQPAWPTNGVSTWDPLASAAAVAAAAPAGQAFRVLDGAGNPILEQPVNPNQVANQPLQVLDGNGNPLQAGVPQPQRVVQDPEQYFDPTLFDEPFQVLDGNGNLLQAGASQPIAAPEGFAAPGIPNDNQILSDVGQTQPGQAIQSSDPSIVPAIVSAPDLWRQVLDDPNIQQFLQDNTPEGLQPLLDPSTKSQLEQNPSIANSLVPSLNHPTPENITPFLNLLNTLPLDQQLDLIKEGHNIASLAQTRPTDLASVIDTIDNLRTPTPFPIDGFSNGFLPGPSVHTDSGSMLFTPNGFEMSPVGPFGPSLLPPFNGIDQNFDGTINQPSGANQDIFGGTFGSIPTNVFLPNGGTISFNCVPVYIDANGNSHSASDVPSQILSAFNVGGQSSFTDQTTDPNTPLTPLLNEVVSGNPDIISASQIDPNTVLVNTQGGDDAEQVIKDFGNGWGAKFEDTDGREGFDTVILENGGTRFEINRPQGFATADVLNAKGPGDILGTAFGEGASVKLETANAAPVPAPAA
ncbi:hypothetical protein TWF281_001041 [Arthrobotrys megalospora]